MPSATNDEVAIATIISILERGNDVRERPADEQDLHRNGPWRSFTERRAALLRLRARKIVDSVQEKATEQSWVAIPGYEGLYEVSDAGHIRSLDRPDATGRRTEGRVLKPTATASGHLRVTLRRGNASKRHWVHRLVLEAFIGPIQPGTEACHNDGNPANNVPANLRWDTKSANALDRTRHGRNKNAKKTHCPQGHEYTPENTYYTTRGWRHCRTCVLAGQHSRNRRIKAEGS